MSQRHVAGPDGFQPRTQRAPLTARSPRFPPPRAEPIRLVTGARWRLLVPHGGRRPLAVRLPPQRWDTDHEARLRSERAAHRRLLDIGLLPPRAGDGSVRFKSPASAGLLAVRNQSGVGLRGGIRRMLPIRCPNVALRSAVTWASLRAESAGRLASTRLAQLQETASPP